MFSTIIHDYFNNHSAATALWGRRTVDLVRFNQTPFASRSPITIKLSEGVLRVFVRVLFPLWIVHPDAVRALVVLMLQSREEFVHYVFFWPVAVHPCQHSDNQKQDDRGNDPVATVSLASGIVLSGIEQGHG